MSDDDDDDDFLDVFAQHMHRMWCEQRREAGWQYGPVFDEDDRTHPRLVEYAELPETHRAGLRDALEDELSWDMLLLKTDVVHEFDEWTVADMRVGLPVRYCDEGCPDPTNESLGKILDWEVDSRGNGRIESFRVQWADGDVGEYEPSARYIVPAE